MTDKNRPWGVHCISDLYSPNVDAGLPDGRWVKAVAKPYTAGRLKAAWWVLTGRAYAFLWPEAGDLERALGAPEPKQKTSKVGWMGDISGTPFGPSDR